MKVFLSWSGHKSHEIAIELKKWIPYVIQSITPYVSSEDIDKGVRWSSDIAKELQDSTFGILCVTKDNYEEPWLLFEAGALSKTLDKSNVCPLLLDLKMTDMNGPLLQFQSTVCEKEDVKKLIFTLNKCCENKLHDDYLEDSFNMWWPHLEKELLRISKENTVDTPSIKKSTKDEKLEEILELTRSNQKVLMSIKDSFSLNFFSSEKYEKVLMPLIRTNEEFSSLFNEYYSEQKQIDESILNKYNSLNDSVSELKQLFLYNKSTALFEIMMSTRVPSYTFSNYNKYDKLIKAIKTLDK